jgi:hypothetical protein
LFILCRIFLSQSTPCTESSFPTWWAQLILCFLLQHHVSKLSRYFWFIFRSVHVSAPYRAELQIWHLNCFFNKFKCNKYTYY